MLTISYSTLLIFISLIWLVVRGSVGIRNKRISWKREAQLMLVYVCIIVVARFVFFPFSKVDGEIQPLLFDVNKIWPFWVNFVPFVHLDDYPNASEAWLNFIGNTTMFIPIGIIFPIVYKELNTHKKVIVAGVVFSLAIEISQLLFYDRCSDIDDLVLNSLGYIVGYGILLLVRKLSVRSDSR